MAIGFPYDRSDESIEKNLKRINILLKNCRELRRDGSAALDMCNVAAGRGGIITLSLMCRGVLLYTTEICGKG